MPNMLDDGLLVQAGTVHTFATIPANSDFLLQNDTQAAINTAAATGAFTCTVDVSAYATGLVQIMIQRLGNMGYTASLSSTTLTVNW